MFRASIEDSGLIRLLGFPQILYFYTFCNIKFLYSTEPNDYAECNLICERSLQKSTFIVFDTDIIDSHEIF